MTLFLRTMMGLAIGMIFLVSGNAEGQSPLQVLPKATPTSILELTPEPTPTLIPFPVSIPDATGLPEWTNRSIRYSFSKVSAEENDIWIQGAGFGDYPQADVSFGYLPVDNAFEGATDGHGIIIQADPGEGVMIFGTKIEDKQSALIRCSVRADQPHALVTIASIGSEPDRFIAVNYPEDESYFTDRYMRLQTFCIPPSMGFQPVIQVVNTSETEALTVYLDNFDIYFIDPNKYYSGNFLDGDEIDPPDSLISVPISFDAKFSDSDFGLKASSSLEYNTTIYVDWNLFYMVFDWIVLQRSTDNSNWVDIYQMLGWFALNNYTDSGLQPNTKYYYRVGAYRWFSWSFSSSVEATTTN